MKNQNTWKQQLIQEKDSGTEFTNLLYFIHRFLGTAEVEKEETPSLLILGE